MTGQLPSGPSSPSARVGPGRLAVRVVGSGPAVGWIHGYTMDSHAFDDIWPLLPGFTHVGVDLPGHGGSRHLPLTMSLAELADQVGDALREHEVRHLVAVSMGTMVAFEIAIRRVVELDSLSVVAPALVGMPTGARTAAMYRTLAMLRRLGLPATALTAAWLSGGTGIFTGLAPGSVARERMSAVVARHCWAELDTGGPTAFFQSAQDIADLPGSARRLLVVAGGADMPEFRELADRLAGGVPGAELAVLPDAGHLPLFEDSPAVLRLLQEFWTRTAVSA